MIENTAEKFLLLIQHPQKSRFIISGHLKSTGMIGAILLDLANEKRIVIENGRLQVKSSTTELSEAHQAVLEQLNKAKKPRKVKAWIPKLSRKSRSYQKALLLALEDKKILKIEYKSFLGISYYRTRLIAKILRKQTIEQIRETILHDKRIDQTDAMIIGLVKACSMYRVICRDRHERKTCRKKVKALMQSDEIVQGMDEVIRDMQVAIIGATVATSAATNAGSN